MFVSRRIARPYTGKMDLVMERTHRLAGILSRHGANTRITRVVAGEGAGEIHVYAQYDTMAAGTAAAAAMMHDPAMQKLWLIGRPIPQRTSSALRCSVRSGAR